MAETNPGLQTGLLPYPTHPAAFVIDEYSSLYVPLPQDVVLSSFCSMHFEVSKLGFIKQVS